MTQPKPSVLIICFNYLDKDPRVLRQISWLENDYQITTVGLAPSGAESIAYLQYNLPKRATALGKIKRTIQIFARNYEQIYWNAEKIKVFGQLKNKTFDLIVANDIETLPLAVKLARGKTRLLFDAHEYAPLEFEDRWRWRLLQKPLVDYLCRKYIPRVDAATTVCQGIAEMYERNFAKEFQVITNAARYEDLKPSQVAPEKIRLIYHGIANPSRQTEKQIEMLEFLDRRFELNLMLVGESAYLERLRKIAEKFGRVNFLPPVATADIPSFTNQFDVGLFLLPPTNFNYRHALPNKFFEFVQARLAIAVAPSPEMAQIVQKFDLGVVAEDFTPLAMARALNSLSAEKINYFKAQSDKSAHQLSAEKNREKFLRLASNR